MKMDAYSLQAAPRGRLLAAVAAAVLLGLAAATVWVFAQPYTFVGSAIDPPISAGEIALTDQFNQPFHLSDLRGKVVLLFFGYTYCPDVCPTTLADFQYIQRQLGEQAGEAAFLFVTVDPERDTPAQLEKHLALFSPTFTGLTGTPEALDAVYRSYGVAHEKEPGSVETGYLVSHTARVYVIDRDGRLRLTFPFGMDKNDMLSDITYLVNE